MDTILTDIKWLIHDSGTAQVEISRATKISTSTINRLKLGQQPLEEMKLKNIIKLDKLAQQQQGRRG